RAMPAIAGISQFPEGNRPRAGPDQGRGTPLKKVTTTLLTRITGFVRVSPACAFRERQDLGRRLVLKDAAQPRVPPRQRGDLLRIVRMPVVDGGHRPINMVENLFDVVSRDATSGHQ